MVLTGGAGRVSAALRLLAENRAPALLVSGVGNAEFPDLARRAGLGASLADRVTIGHAAATTRGNAVETADWARGIGARSLIVVTSGYHMARALAELSRVMPGVALYPVSVLPAGERLGLRLLAGEYTKFLAAGLGLTRWGDDLLDPHADTRRPSDERKGG